MPCSSTLRYHGMEEKKARAAASFSISLQSEGSASGSAKISTDVAEPLRPAALGAETTGSAKGIVCAANPFVDSIVARQPGSRDGDEFIRGKRGHGVAPDRRGRYGHTKMGERD